MRNIPRNMWRDNASALALGDFNREVEAVHDENARHVGRGLEKYLAALRECPAPGTGAGCHAHLLRTANYGRIARVLPEKVYNDIREAIPAGQRLVSEREIRAAIRTAFASPFEPQSHHSVAATVDRDAAWGRIHHMAGVVSKDDILASSPEKIICWDGTPVGCIGQAIQSIDSLYEPYEHIFAGGEFDGGGSGGCPEVIRTAEDLLAHLASPRVRLPEFVMPNPLSGRTGMKKDGGHSYRCDDAVLKRRFALIEFDDRSIEDQLAFFATVKLPIALLVLSGGKSVHGWVRLPEDRGAADAVTSTIYAELVPIGADGQCRNASRLSRFPGAIRPGTGRLQELIYLAPTGRAVQ